MMFIKKVSVCLLLSVGALIVCADENPPLATHLQPQIAIKLKNGARSGDPGLG